MTTRCIDGPYWLISCNRLRYALLVCEDRIGAPTSTVFIMLDFLHTVAEKYKNNLALDSYIENLGERIFMMFY